MDSHKEFMQALVNGYTLIDVNEQHVTLNEDGMLADEKGWLIPESSSISNYSRFRIKTVMGTPEMFAALSGHKLFDPATDVDPILPANLGKTIADEFKEFKKSRTTRSKIIAWCDKYITLKVR